MGDEATMPDWILGFKRIELVSGTPNTLGAVSNVYIEENGEEMVMEETITAFEPNKQLGMKFTMDFMNMDYNLFLKEEAGKTLILTTSQTTGNSLFAKSIVSFMTKSMKAQEDENLNNLKRIIEENTKDYLSEQIEELEN